MLVSKIKAKFIIEIFIVEIVCYQAAKILIVLVGHSVKKYLNLYETLPNLSIVIGNDNFSR